MENVTESMAMQSSFRCLLSQLQRCASPAVQRSILPKFSTPFRRNLPLLFSTSQRYATHPPLAAAAKESILVLKKDERLGDGASSCADPDLDSSTIAAIVTSMGGPPGAVGIVRLSGPLAVSIAGKVLDQCQERGEKVIGGGLIAMLLSTVRFWIHTETSLMRNRLPPPPIDDPPLLPFLPNT